jgi:alpha-tubulin suppressor-like RCC1 family protein
MVLAVAATLAPAAPAAALSPKVAEKERIKDLCRRNGLEIVDETSAQCSHGEDPPPHGKDIKQDVKPVSTPPASELGAVGSSGRLAPGAPLFTCDGDGQTGFRTQVLYVHASDTADRYAAYRASFQQWAWEADQIYRLSAQDTGGMRRIRFVHDSTCTPTVLNVTVSPSGDDNLGNTITQLEQAGYERTDRKYMIFMDANVLCGVGTMVADDRPGQENWNNQGPDYARIDAGCWSGDIAAHEHMHTMGGVQNSAPHASGGNHCTDEYDVMCYSDAPNFPAMQTLCPTSSRDWSRFDCNYDDYFNTNPPIGSYLSQRWNTVNNRFLASDNGGFTPPAPCPDQASEPDETYTAAQAIVPGTARARSLCATGDQDWMSFRATANQRYRVEIVSHASSTTPAIEVYGRTGKKLLGSSAPVSGGLAVVDIRARAGGNHYVKVRNTPDLGSPGNTYSVKVTELSPAGALVGGFGYNTSGQVGGAPAGYKPTPVAAFNMGAVQVAGGVLHSAAVLADGTVRTWGSNSFGQLGNGTMVDSTTPAQPAIGGVAAVTAGYLHTVVLKKDGTVWGWGWNGAGQLGDGTLTDSLTPVQVSGLTDVVEVSAGWFHNLALKQDGSVWAWGYNEWSTLGDGGTANRSLPVKVNIPAATSVAAGGYHSLAALEDGTVRSWGFNAMAQLGDGSRVNRSLPVPVYGLTNTYKVSAGWTHSVALRNDGGVWAWGINTQQQAGGAPSADRLIAGPVVCPATSSCPKLAGTQHLGRIVWIAANSSLHTLALCEDGTVWTWGWNGVGQLGNGTLANSGVPVRAAGLLAGDVAATFYHSLYRACG